MQFAGIVFCPSGPTGRASASVSWVRCVGSHCPSPSSYISTVSQSTNGKRRAAQGVARAETVRRLVADLRGQQEEQNCADSVVLGDFNVQPFSNEMIWATLLNATFFKEVATRVRDKRAGSEMYPFMYNPTLEHFTEAGDNCGSFYSSSGADTFYWYCLDQAVVSPSLANSVVEYRYLKKDRGYLTHR